MMMMFRHGSNDDFDPFNRMMYALKVDEGCGAVEHHRTFDSELSVLQSFLIYESFGITLSGIIGLSTDYTFM